MLNMKNARGFVGVFLHTGFPWFHLASWAPAVLLRLRESLLSRVLPGAALTPWGQASPLQFCQIAGTRGTQLKMVLLTVRISSLSQSLAITGSSESERAS